MSPDVRKLVIDLITSMGRAEAAEKFGVTRQTVLNWENGGTPSVDAIQIAVDLWYGSMKDTTQAMSWEGREVYILQPSYKDICTETHETLFRNYAKYGPHKIGRLSEKGTLIEDARNALATRFVLQTKGKWAIFCDDDMVYPCGDAEVYNSLYGMELPNPYAGYMFLDRILSHQKPLVGGLYFGRHPKGKAQYAEAFESDEEDMRAHRLVGAGLKPTRWVATGAMAIHRSVFETIMQQAPEKFPDIVPKKATDPWAFFRRLGPQIGEDVSFCHRALGVGIQPYVDTACVCGHIGPTCYGPANTMARFVRSR